MNIKQIVNFQLKYLRMAGFLEFVQQVLNIVKTYRDSGEAGVSQLPAKVEAAYTPFASGIAVMDDAYKLSRASEFTQQIADEDTRRDGLYTALKNQVLMYTRFDFDTAKKAALANARNVVDERYRDLVLKHQKLLLHDKNRQHNDIGTVNLTVAIDISSRESEGLHTNHIVHQINDVLSIHFTITIDITNCLL